MANIAVLVPTPAMQEQAQRVIEQEKIDIQLLKIIQTADAINEARNAVENGANIVVARGLQAQLIKLHTNIPIIEMKFTGQELGLLILKAKTLINEPRPTIAFVGFHNLFSNMDHFEDLFQIRLRLYYVNYPDEMAHMVQKAKDEGADVLIGGKSALYTAQKISLPAIFYESTEESIREALDIALRAGYAIDVEKQSNAQLESILDTSISGITKIGIDHTITMVNAPMETIFQAAEGKLLGRPIREIIKGITPDFIEEILLGEQVQASTSVRIHNTLYIVMAAPIQYDKKITGAIFSFHRMRETARKNLESTNKTPMHDYITHSSFSQILRKSKTIKRIISLAKKYALSKSPLFVFGEDGTEKEIFTGAIHNNSVRRNEPFVAFDCRDCPADLQASILFGDATDYYLRNITKGLLHTANYGTLLIHNIEYMEPHCQNRLYNYLIGSNTNYGPYCMLDVRIIMTAQKSPAILSESKQISQDLFHIIGLLVLALPALRENKEDILSIAKHYMKEYSESYSHFVVVSKEAYEAIGEYSWPGNIPQLKLFCEHLILSVGKRRIDEVFVREQLEALFPNIVQTDEQYKIVVNKHPQAERIEKLLHKHQGHRAKVASELGISTTTLWRHMKKYGVSKDS